VHVADLVAPLVPVVVSPFVSGVAPVVATMATTIGEFPLASDLAESVAGGFPASALPLSASGGSSASQTMANVLFAVLVAFSFLWLGRSWRLWPVPLHCRSLNLDCLLARPG
jgi:hypothetical protein